MSLKTLCLSLLPSCASCTEQTDANLCCARCRTLYCSRQCQKAHWGSGGKDGHKQTCEGIARAHRVTNTEVQSRALARVSHMSGGAPDDAHCLFCLDRGDATEPLVRGCACRGSSWWGHATCLVKMAEYAPAPTPPAPHFAPWLFCLKCKQPFTGKVQLQLAIALWGKHVREVETDGHRLGVASTYTVALGAAGGHADAARLQQGILDVFTQAVGPEHSDTLVCASNLAVTSLQLGGCAEAAVLLRTTIAARTRTSRPDDRGTLTTEGYLINALYRLGRHTEAVHFRSGPLPGAQHVWQLGVLSLEARRVRRGRGD